MNNKLKTIVSELYSDYEQGRLDKVLNRLPDDFQFVWPVDPKYTKYSGNFNSRDEMAHQLKRLSEDFEFKRFAPTNIIIEGNQVAAQIEMTLVSRKTNETLNVCSAHFWTFKDDEPVRLIEYTDSAIVANQCS